MFARRRAVELDRNLLFGVLALQTKVIDASQLAEAGTAWAARKDASLADLLIERGWITPEERVAIDHLIAIRLRRHGDDPRTSLAASAAVPSLWALADIDDEEVHASVTTL